jgi:hypothetical protein
VRQTSPCYQRSVSIIARKGPRWLRGYRGCPSANVELDLTRFPSTAFTVGHAEPPSVNV